jgi:[acyl-carrier-protein] S-malonyltransferase
MPDGPPPAPRLPFLRLLPGGAGDRDSAKVEGIAADVTSRTAWVFPGQGAQEPGMGRDLYDAYPVARKLFDRADAILNRSLTRLCFEAPADELNDTANAQPALYTTSLACLEVARATHTVTVDPDYVAGHSLGEYTALAAIGALSFEDGLRLVEERGRLTRQAAEATSGGMVAVLGLDEATVQAVCDESGAELCNINAPGQIVIGGAEDSIERAIALASERGARRAIRLDVAGAFHTTLMDRAIAPFRQAVSSTAMEAPRAPFVANQTASPLTDPAAIADELVYQLTHPVRWVACVEFLAAQGIEQVVEFGPGRVLTGLIKRIAPTISLQNVNGVAALTVT